MQLTLSGGSVRPLSKLSIYTNTPMGMGKAADSHTWLDVFVKTQAPG